MKIVNVKVRQTRNGIEATVEFEKGFWRKKTETLVMYSRDRRGYKSDWYTDDGRMFDYRTKFAQSISNAAAASYIRDSYG